MSRWILCLTHFARLNRLKEHRRDNQQYAYRPVARCARGREPQRVETLEPRMLFSATPLASAHIEPDDLSIPAFQVELERFEGSTNAAHADAPEIAGPFKVFTKPTIRVDKPSGPYHAVGTPPTIAISAASSQSAEGSLYTLTIEQTDAGDPIKTISIDWLGDGNPIDYQQSDGWGPDVVQTSTTTWVATYTYVNHDGWFVPSVSATNTGDGTSDDVRPALTDVFGGDGQVYLAHTGLSASNGYVTAVQNDGKILVASSTGSGLVIGRLNPDGTTDNTFGTSGFATVDFSGTTVTTGLFVDSLGRVVVTGFEHTNYTLHAARFLPNGQIDTSYGSNADGKVVDASIYHLHASTLDNNDNLYFGGFTLGSGLTPSVGKLDQNGVLDSSFGASGVATIASGVTGYFMGITVDPDTADVWATGLDYTAIDTDEKLLVAKFKANGSLDTAGFNSTGYVLHTLPGIYAYGRAIAQQPDGKILIAGVGSSSTVFVTRIDEQDGSLDSTFNSGTPQIISASQSSGLGLSIKDDGEVLLGYTHGGAFNLRMFDSIGAVDTSFGENGSLAIGSHATSYSSLTQTGFSVAPDGGIVMAGYAPDPGNSDPSFSVIKAHTGVSVANKTGVGENHAPTLDDAEVIVLDQTPPGGFELSLLPLLRDVDNPSNDSWSFSVTGGADAALFTINHSTSKLKIINPGDQDDLFEWTGQSVFEVHVTVEDREGLTATSIVTVRVSPDNIQYGSYITPVIQDAMREALGLSPDAVLIKSQVENDLKELTLVLDGGPIDLRDLRYAKSLEKLTIIPRSYENAFSSAYGFGFLSYLTDLQSLTIHNAGISDIADVTAVLPATTETLDLGYNDIASIASTVSIPDTLKELRLFANPIADPQTYPLGDASAITMMLGPLKGSLLQTDLVALDPDSAATIEDLAQRLYYSPVRMYEWVVNNIAFQPYANSMKGPVATFETRAGNAWDTAWLMAELLNQAGVSESNIDFYTGRLKLGIEDAKAYVGARGVRAAYEILEGANLNPWMTDADNGDAETHDHTIADHITIDHTWLSFKVGTNTYHLDPAWKVKEQGRFAEDLNTSFAGADILNEVPIEIFENSPGGSSDFYLNEYRQIDAVEFYEDQVRDWLAENHPGLTIADILYDGPIQQISVDELGSQPPAGIVSSSSAIDAASAGTSVPWQVDIPDEHKQQLIIRYGWDVSGGGFLKSAIWQFYLPDVTHSRIAFVPVDHPTDATKMTVHLTVDGVDHAPDQSVEWDGANYSIPTNWINTSANAIVKEVGSDPNKSTTELSVTLGSSIAHNTHALHALLTSSGELLTQNYGGLEDVSQVRLIAVDAYNNSTSRLNEIRQAVTETQLDFLDDPTAFLDSTNLAQYLSNKSKLVGGVLELFGATYYNLTNNAEERLGNLTGGVPVYLPAVGTANSSPVLRENVAGQAEGYGYTDLTGDDFVDTILQQLYPVLPDDIQFDLFGGRWEMLPRFDSEYEYVQEVVTIEAELMGNGLLGDDAGTGTGYILYSEQAIGPNGRFNTIPNSANDHFAVVKLAGEQWQYYDNSNWVNFNPISKSDLLVAEIAMTGSDVITSYEGQDLAPIGGIARDYVAGNLVFNSNWWIGANGLEENSAEHYLHTFQAVDINPDDGLADSVPSNPDDVELTLNRYVPNTTGLSRTNLTGFAGSYYESGVIERLFNLPAASTVSLLQFALDSTTNDVVEVNASNYTSKGLHDDIEDAMQGVFATEPLVDKVYTVKTPFILEAPSGDADDRWVGFGYVTVDETGLYRGYRISDNVTVINGSAATGGIALTPQIGNNSNFNLFPTTVSDPVDVASGAVYHDETDFVIPNLGVPLSFSRHYDSSNTAAHLEGASDPSTWLDAWSDRGMGHGWSFSNSDRIYHRNTAPSEQLYPGDWELPAAPAGKPANYHANALTWFTDTGERLQFKYMGTAAGGYIYETPYGMFGQLRYFNAFSNPDQDNPTAEIVWTDTEGNQVVFSGEWNDSGNPGPTYGRLLRKTDRHGNGVAVEYDATNPYQIDYVYAIDPDNASNHDRRIRYVYYSGRLTGIENGGADGDISTTGDNIVSLFSYDQYFNFGAVDPLTSGHTVLRTVLHPSGAIFTNYTYYGDGTTETDLHAGLLHKVIAPDGGTTAHTYFANRRGFQVQLSDGGVETIDYNLFVPQVGTSPEIVFGRRTHFTDAVGNETIYQFDHNGKTAKEIYADQTTVETVWHDTYGVVLESIDEYGQAEVYHYPTSGTNLEQNRPSIITDRHGISTYFYYGSGSFDASMTVGGYTIPLLHETNRTGDPAGVSGGASRWSPSRRRQNYYNTSGQIIVAYDYATTTYQWFFYDTRGLVTHQLSHEDILASGYTTPNATTDYNNAASNLAALDQLTEYGYNDAGLVTRVMRREDGSVVAEAWKFYDGLGRLTYEMDAEAVERYSGTYATAQANLGTVSGPKYFKKYEYDSLGRVTTVTDQEGDISDTAYPDPVQTNYQYNNIGKATQTTVDFNHGIEHVSNSDYNHAGEVVRVVLPDGTEQSLHYDAKGSLIAEVDALGGTTHYTLDNRDRVIRAERPDGTVEAIRYTGGGRVERITDALGNTVIYEYDKLGRLSSEAYPDPDGDAGPLEAYKLHYNYNGFGDLVEITTGEVGSDDDYYLWDPVDIALPEVWYFYDSQGRRIGTADQLAIENQGVTNRYWNNQNQTNFSYDSRTVYDKDGNITEQLDRAGNTTWFFYDGQGRLIATVDAVGVAAYDAQSGTSYATAKSLFEAYCDSGYSQAGYDTITGTTGNPIFNWQVFEYDANGNVIRTSDSRYNWTWQYYDSLGRNIAGVSPDSIGYWFEQFESTEPEPGEVTIEAVYEYVRSSFDASPTFVEHLSRTYYDDAGNTIRTIDASDRRNWFYYDKAGRLTQSLAPDAVKQRLLNAQAYDDFIGTSDSLDDATHYGYNANGDLIRQVEPDGTTTHYKHDASGRVETIRTTDGSEKVARYNALGDVTETIDAQGQRTWFFYDARGRQTHVTNELGIDAYGGDYASAAAGIAAGTLTLTHTAESVFDQDGNLIKQIDALGNETWIFYDLLGRQSLVVSPEGVAEYTGDYEDIRSNTNLTNGNNGLLDVSYDTTPKLYSLGKFDALQTLVSDWTLTRYDQQGNVARISSSTDVETWYFYDRLGRQVAMLDPIGVENYGSSHYSHAAVRFKLLESMSFDESDYNTINTYLLVNARDRWSGTIYDEDGNIAKTIDADNNQTWYFYDRSGRRSHVLNAKAVAEYTLTPGNDYFTARSALRTWADQHDVHNQALGALPSGLETATFVQYDLDGRMIETRDAMGNTSWVFYDSAGREFATVNALGTEAYAGQHADAAALLAAFEADGFSDAAYQTLAQNLSHWVVTVYDEAGRVIETIDSSNQRSWAFYDEMGRQAAAVDAVGVDDFGGSYAQAAALFRLAAKNGYPDALPLTGATATVYDAVGRAIETIDAAGNRTWTFYDALGRVQHAVDAIGVFDYLNAHPGDTYADITDVTSQIREAYGHTTSFKYDEPGRVTETTDARGNTSWSFYDVNGRAFAAVNAIGVADYLETAGNDYASAADLFEAFAEAGYSDAGYDTLHNEITHWGVSVYDGRGNVIETVDSHNARTWFFYDRLDRQIAVLNAKGVSKYTSQSGTRTHGTAASLFNSFGTSGYYNTSQYNTLNSALDDWAVTVYDHRGNVIESIDSYNGRTWTFYNELNQPVYVFDAVEVGKYLKLSNAYRHDYPSPNNIFDKGYKYTEQRYDDNGRLIESIDPHGNKTWFFYDALGRQTHMTDARGVGTGIWGLEYENADPEYLSHTTKIIYDELGRAIEQIDALGGRRWTFYNQADRVTHTFDAERVAEHLEQGRTYESVRLSLDSAEAVVGANTTHYDARGLVTESIDAGGNRTWYFYDRLGREVQVLDAIGVEHYLAEMPGLNAQAAYEQLAEDVANEAYLFRASSVVYDDNGNVIRTLDPMGNQTWLFYDALNRNYAELDSNELHQVFWSISQSNSSLYNFELYHPLIDSLVLNSDESGHVYYTETFYDEVGNPFRVNDANDNDTWFFYDELGNLTGQMLPEQVARFLNQTPTGYTADYGSAKDYLDSPSEDPSDIGASVTVYDESGRVIESSDALGNTAWFFYDKVGRQTHVIDDTAGIGTTWGSVNTALQNNPATHYNRIARTIYNELGQVTHEVSADPDGTATAHDVSVTYFAYDKVGNLIKVTEPLGGVSPGQTPTADPDSTTWYFYDALDRLAYEVDAEGVKDYLAQLGSNSYEQIAGFLVGGVAGPTVYPTHMSSSRYNADGRLVSFTDAEDNTTRYRYDARGQLISEANTLGQSRQYTYDALGNTTSIVDRNGRERRFNYDLLGRQAREQWIDPADGSAVRSIYTAYDHNGNIRFVIDQNADSFTGTTEAVYTYHYDYLDRLVRERSVPFIQNGSDASVLVTDLTIYPASAYSVHVDLQGTSFVEEDLVYGWVNWDDDAQYGMGATNFIDGGTGNDVVALYRHDDIPINETFDFVYYIANNPTIDTIYTYDDNNNLKSITDVHGVQTTHGYNDANQRTSTQQTDTDTTGGADVDDKFVEFTYNAIGQTETITRYDGLDDQAPEIAISAYGYDFKGRLTSIEHDYEDAADGLDILTTSETNDLSYAWVYDAADRIVTADSPSDSDTYQYDDTNQLESADSTNNQDDSYAYDENGNRISQNGGAVVTNTLNQIVKRYVSGSTGSYYEYTYDAEGNRTSVVLYDAQEDMHTTWTYEWDHANQLTHTRESYGSWYVGTGESPSTYHAYDPFGSRIAKAASNWYVDPELAPTTYYTYVDDHIASTYRDSDGSNGSGVAASTYYLHGPRMDAVLAQDVSSVSADVLWSLSDQIGSVRHVLEASTSNDYIVAHDYDYDAFGGDEMSTGGTPTPVNPHGGEFRFGFAGREFDPTSGLYYYRARFYDAETGRFLSEDPTGFAAGDPNLYRYTGNAPTFRTDATGLAWTGIAGGATATHTNGFQPAFGSIGGSGSGSFGGLSLGSNVGGGGMFTPYINSYQSQSQVVSDRAFSYGFDTFYHDAVNIDQAQSSFANSVANVNAVIDGVNEFTENNYGFTRPTSYSGLGNGSSDIAESIAFIESRVKSAKGNLQIYAQLEGKARELYEQGEALLAAGASPYRVQTHYFDRARALSYEAQRGRQGIFDHLADSFELAGATVHRVDNAYYTYARDVNTEIKRQQEYARYVKDNLISSRLSRLADSYGNISVNSTGNKSTYYRYAAIGTGFLSGLAEVNEDRSLITQGINTVYGTATDYIQQSADYLGNQSVNSNTLVGRLLFRDAAILTGYVGGVVEQYGSIQAGVTGFALDPLGSIDQIAQNIDTHRSHGLSTYDSLVLQFNPLTGLAEAIDGRSYQAQDFGRELDDIERATRGTLSVVNTAGVAVGGVSSLRTLAGGQLRTYTMSQIVDDSLAFSKSQIIPRLNIQNYRYVGFSPEFDPNFTTVFSGVPSRFPFEYNPSRGLLPGELQSGKFGDLRASGTPGDNLTPHHGPSARYLREVHGISRDDGIAILLEHYYPSNKGRHALTRTYGHRGKDPNLLNESFRVALGRDVRDVRRILIEDGVYDSAVRKRLNDWIDRWRQEGPGLFEKESD